MSATELLRLEMLVALSVVGAVVGSFLNVCIYRLPIGKSVVTPPSACPRCGQRLKPWHNVPIVSWILLRGRCACCHEPISVRYPLVEALNAGLWLGAGLHFGLDARTFVLLPLLSALVVLFFTDYDHQLLPDKVTLPSAAIGLAVAAWNPLLDLAPGFLGQGGVLSRLASSAAGAALGYGLFFTLAMVWQVLFARDAMGGGDLKMMLAVGAFLGLGGVLVTIFLASIVGTLLSLPYLLSGRWGMTRQLPFGCFLAPAAAITAFWGNQLISWYVGLLMLA